MCFIAHILYTGQVSPFPESLGSSMIQLISSECLWKLGEDLLQLFVFRPTHDLSHPLSALPSLYQECFSKKLMTSVYSATSLEQVLRSKVLKKVIHVSLLTVANGSEGVNVSACVD